MLNKGTDMKPIMKTNRRADALKPGQTMTEYVLILSAVAVALLGGFHVMGATLTRMVETIAAAL
jgi:Flp pilus assembly pilin Flp